VVVLAWSALTGCGGGGDGPDGPRADATTDASRPDAAPPMFGAAVTLSDPANGSFLPAIATRAGRVVVAWHDFPMGGTPPSRIVTTTIIDGVPGPLAIVPEPLLDPKRPTLAATTAGFVLAWDATDAGVPSIRTIDLDADGAAIGTPVTISAAGVTGLAPRVAALGDDVAWAWTDGTTHYFARRGPVETVAATPVGTTLISTGLLNFPRIAVTGAGELLLAYRDGGVDAIDWEVLLEIKPVGSAFAGPLDISRSPGLLSDDISLAVEPDDTLDVVWVDQDPIDVNTFEVSHATRDPAGLIAAPVRFGTQGAWAWTPSAIPGMTAAWHTGAGAGGDLWLAEAGGAPSPILPGEQGAMVALTRDDGGALHLVYVTPSMPRAVRYASTLNR